MEHQGPARVSASSLGFLAGSPVINDATAPRRLLKVTVAICARCVPGETSYLGAWPWGSSSSPGPPQPGAAVHSA